MQHLADVRAAQDHALRDSLAYSSFSALTLVVAVLLGAVLLRGPDSAIIVCPGFPPIDEPERRILPPPIDPGTRPPGGAQEPGPLVVTAGEADTSRAVPWADLADPGPAIAEPGIGGSSPGTGPVAFPAEDAVPAPDEFVFHDELPRVVHKVQPEYPELPRTAGMKGKVLVRVFIGVDGRIRRAEVEGRASVFDEAALAAVRQWVFTPAKANGHPVAVWMRIPVVFRLD